MSALRTAGVLAAGAVLGTTILAAGQAPVFRDNFDNYASDAALALVWPNSGPTPTGGLDVSRFISAPASLYHPGGPYQRYHIFADSTTGLLPNDTDPILLKFKYYEDGLITKRFGVELLNGWPRNAMENGYLDFGVYHLESENEYWYRTVSLGGPGWSPISGTQRKRSTPGWRSFRCLIYASKITFQVDGLPATPFEVNCKDHLTSRRFMAVAFGSPSDLTSLGGGGNLDNLHISYLSDEFTYAFARADLNQDRYVDAADFEVFMACAAGPEVDHAGGTQCEQADADDDGDVDHHDFAVFQRCWSGAALADPDCGE